MYPIDSGDYVPLKTALDKLTLNDSSVTVYPDSSAALGQGWRLGFLGLLHMDVFRQRLEEVRIIITWSCVGITSVLLCVYDSCCTSWYRSMMLL